MAQQYRRLVWGLMAEAALADAVAVLDVINPKGHSAAHIKAHVQRAFDEGLDSYVGTAGWYATVYRAPGSNPFDLDGETWDVMVSLMPYSVKRYLEERA